MHLGQHFFSPLPIILSSPSWHGVARVCCVHGHRQTTSSKQAWILRCLASLGCSVMSWAIQPKSTLEWACIRTSLQKCSLLWHCGKALYFLWLHSSCFF